MKSLRVMHLIPSFVGGGAERQLSYLALALAELGHDVHIGYLYGGPNLTRLLGTSVKLHQLRSRGNHDPRLVLRVLDLLRVVRPDVVQTWLLQMDVFGGAASVMARIPWILSERCSAEMYSNGWKNRIRYLLGQKADAIVANSNTGLEYWKRTRANRLRVVRNIVPLNGISDLRNKPQGHEHLAHARELIVAAGRLNEQKNWFVLFEALRTLLNARPGAYAVILGEGDLDTPLRALLQTYECSDRIFMRGYVRDLWEWFRCASVYVSVSRYEGTPNAVLEAVACKCPVVLSDISSHREILTKEEAIFVPLESPSAIADSLHRVLDQTAEARARAHRAFGSLTQWSGPAIAQQYVDLYRYSARQRDG